MKLTIASLTTRTSKANRSAIDIAVDDYILRSGRYVPMVLQTFASEAAFLERVARSVGRVPPRLILCDGEGEMLSSVDFAGHIARFRDTSTQNLILAVGPADGWSDLARRQANLLVSFGRITLPHELARLVLAEQVYRALTILAGHPYHSGHKTRQSPP